MIAIDLLKVGARPSFRGLMKHDSQAPTTPPPAGWPDEPPTKPASPSGRFPCAIKEVVALRSGDARHDRDPRRRR